MPGDNPSTKTQIRKAREARLAAELRENLRKRKAQGRIRRDAEPAPADGTAAESGEPASGGAGTENN
jgi:hypothetical protein